MVEERVREILTLEKEAQLRLTRAQMEADEIKKEGQREARRILEQGKSQFWQEAKKEKEELKEQLEQFKQNLLTQHEGKIRKMREVYQKYKGEFIKEFGRELWKYLEK